MLISIQGLILIEQPYFNEPAYDVERNTTEVSFDVSRCVPDAFAERQLATVGRTKFAQLQRNAPIGYRETRGSKLSLLFYTFFVLH